LVSPGNPTGTLAITGNLTLLGTSTLLIELGGTGQGTTYDFLSVGGSAFLGGNLSLHFTNSFHTTVQPGDTFTILSGTSLSGTFANAPVNGRYTFNGFGSFDLTYTSTSVLLSNIAAVPEPSTWALMLSGVLLVAWQIRRRVR